MLSVILDHSNKTSLPKKYAIFLSLSEISTLQEKSSWKARLSYLNPKALKIHGFYVIRGQKHWINVQSSNKWKLVKLKGINILSVTSEKKDGDSHHRTGLDSKPSTLASKLCAITEEHWFLIYFLHSNLI